MEDYRVQLDFYDGPMDLLLYLVRRNEVDINDIPIAAITDQYCRYVELLRAVDINLAGEFLVMAAWLMEIKTRLLLPADAPVPAEGDTQASAADSLADPRAELVRQLLAYKRFKDLADELGEAAAEHALKFPRAGIDWKQIAGEEDEPAIDLADVQIWDLFEAFGKLMDSIGRNVHNVTFDDTPIQEHQADIVDRLATAGSLRFQSLFENKSRSQIVGLFLALLELIRQKRVRITQPRPFADIELVLRDPTDAAAESSAGSPAAAPADDAPAKGKRRKPWEESAARAGVTWVEPDEDDDPRDIALREIDQALKAIRIPADPDVLANGPVPDPDQPAAPPDADAAAEAVPPAAAPEDSDASLAEPVIAPAEPSPDRGEPPQN